MPLSVYLFVCIYHSLWSSEYLFLGEDVKQSKLRPKSCSTGKEGYGSTRHCHVRRHPGPAALLFIKFKAKFQARFGSGFVSPRSLKSQNMPIIWDSFPQEEHISVPVLCWGLIAGMKATPGATRRSSHVQPVDQRRPRQPRFYFYVLPRLITARRMG